MGFSLAFLSRTYRGGESYRGGEKVVPRRVPSNMFLKILFFGFSAGVGLFHREALCCHSFFTTARSGSPAARRPGELEARQPTSSPGQVAWQPEPAWKAADVGNLIKPVNLGRFSIAGTPFRRMGYRQYPIPWNRVQPVPYSVE